MKSLTTRDIPPLRFDTGDLVRLRYTTQAYECEMPYRLSGFIWQGELALVCDILWFVPLTNREMLGCRLLTHSGRRLVQIQHLESVVVNECEHDITRQSM